MRYEETHRDELEKALLENNETLDDIISNTMTEEEMNTIFSPTRNSFIIPFCAWTEKYVYFPCEHYSEQCISSVSRHPNGKTIIISV